MKVKHLSFIGLSLLIIASCENSTQRDEKSAPKEISSQYELEKAAILKTLNNETKAAFTRDYEAWQSYWLHDPTISKTYLDFSDSTFSESIGWKEISLFVKTFLEEHPEPEPVPELLDEINVRFYENGAWVIFEQQDSLRGLKRETRLMEKIDGQWKIAGMQTTIYGYRNEE